MTAFTGLIGALFKGRRHDRRLARSFASKDTLSMTDDVTRYQLVHELQVGRSGCRANRCGRR